MKSEQLESLIAEVELILGTDPILPRKLYFEGARDYLHTLKRLTQESEALPKKHQKRKAKNEPEVSV